MRSLKNFTVLELLLEGKGNLVGIAQIASESSTVEEFLKKVEQTIGHIAAEAKKPLIDFYNLKTKGLS